MGAADRIAETILRQGQIQAEGLQRSADIQARAQQNNAQIWSGALQGLGQIPGEIAKAKVLDTENQIRQQQLDQQKKFQNDLFNANEIYQYTTRPGPDGSVQFDEDKLPGMVQKMSAAGINPDVVEHFAGAYKGMNQTMSSFRDTQLKHQADFANYMLQSASPEHPLTPATSLAAAKVAQANGLANTDDINKMMAAFNQGKDPTEVFKAIANYGKASAPLKPPTNESELAYRAAQGDPVAIAAMNRAHPEKSAEPPKGFTNETELRQDAATQGTSEETPTAWRSVETLRQMAADKEKPAANEPTVTIRTTDKNGRPIERVMTRSQALQEGSFPSQPRAAAGGGAPGTPQLTQDAIEDTATRYRILGTGAIPTRIEGPERVRVMNEAAKQQRALGQSAAQGIQKMAANKADAASLTKMQSMADAASASEAKALAQADLVGQLSSKVNRSQSPLWNDWLLSGKKKVLGDQDTTLLFNALDTFTSEYAKIINGSTGSVAGASDSATKKAEGLISAALNKGTLQATVDQMKWEMGQTIKGYGATIEHINDRLQTGAGGAPAPPAAAPASGGRKIVSVTPVP